MSLSSSPQSAPRSRREFLAGSLALLLSHAASRAGTVISDPIGAGVGKIEADPTVLQEAIPFEAYMVTTDPSITPIECLDGRRALDTDAPVGAKLAGGAVSLQAAFAITGKPIDDAAALQLFGPDKGQVPYIPGGHIDKDHSVGGESIVNPDIPGTGCGASDKLLEILHLFKTDGAKLKGVVGKLLGNDFDGKMFDALISKTSETVPHDPKSLASRFAQQKKRGALDVLDSGDHHPKNHNHHESHVIFNSIPKTTLDSNRLQKNHPNAQAFCVDMWLLRDIAAHLFPADAMARKEYLHALVAYQVATYYALANGSQKAVFIS